ncbi:MAG: hypothetical protein J7500_08120 [Sphingomonas sp.]|uniref:hypothetical protein n=1 Tax=Sphingomonas sp. TaxID=28214 RepID=UPI001B21F605|nr:hypothetical protein [Sphingomonas sp.]MBO9622664.1 hypothetical protein [Sphingomonas sp.]
MKLLCLAFLGIIAFVTIGIGLENYLGVPFAVTYRVACAGACLYIIAQFGSDYPGERWPWIGLLIALLFNLGLFFSPLARLPASKGDILFFGLPDATIMLAARIVSYRVTDDHQRAVRQQMIVSLILAMAFSALFLSIMFIPSPSPIDPR